MLQIAISREDLEKNLSTTISQIDEIYPKLEVSFIDSVARLEERTSELNDDEIEKVSKDLLKRYICLDAFYRAIPELDLILTPTGFGIVSNNTLAPASKERVEALSANLYNTSAEVLGVILDRLRRIPSWSARNKAGRMLALVSDYRRYTGNNKATIYDIEAKTNVIISCRMLMVKKCGYALVDDMLNKSSLLESGLDVPQVERDLIILLRTLEGSFINGSDLRCIEDDIICYLENNISKLPLYESSDIYRARHEPAYENKKEAPNYWL